MSKFIKPERKIKVESDMPSFFNSLAYNQIIQFITLLNDSCLNLSIIEVEKLEKSENITSVLNILEELSSLIDSFPPNENSSRFGNTSYRDWFKAMEEKVPKLILDSLIEELKESEIELSPYLIHSFGNFTRIDYGTGHELNFLVFLFNLTCIEFFKFEEFKQLGLVVINKYLKLVRKIQLTYKLEPAGSHGVWGLDDFQFIPYILGSAQLKDEMIDPPSLITNLKFVERMRGNNLFLGAIDFISQVKQGPFNEHSPMLYDISGVPYWHKVNKGLQKMYVDEVLRKFPVVQHLVFGNMFSFKINSNNQ